jgi:hypothetical protein
VFSLYYLLLVSWRKAPLEKRNYPKARFSSRLPTGEFLNLSIWQGKSDPNAEVLRVELRKLEKDTWQSVARIAVYRTADGKYSQLPDRAKANVASAPVSNYEPGE